MGGYGTDGKKFYDGVGATEHAAIIQPTIKFMEGMGTLIVSYLKPNLKNFTLTPNPGDRILLYSDGILEVFDEAGEIYGDEHLLSSVKNHSDKKGEEFLNALYEDSMSFSAKRISDDMSMLLLEIL